MANATKTNGKVDQVELIKCAEDKTHYEMLVKELQKEMEVIDNILQKYYRANRIFPVKDPVSNVLPHLYKWSVERNSGSSLVEVFFREGKEGYDHHAVAAKIAATPQGAAAPAGAAPDGGKVAEPGVLTYSLVGAPPAGTQHTQAIGLATIYSGKKGFI